MATEQGRSAWRVSARSNGSSTCVQAQTQADHVRVRNSNDPDGPSIAVQSSEWLTLLDHVAVGVTDYSVLAGRVAAGSFVVSLDDDGQVLLACGDDVVRFTKAEWDVFVAGVTVDGEFTLDWLLLQAPSRA